MPGYLQRLRNYLSTESKLLLKNSSWVLISNLTKVFFIFLKSIFITQALGVKQYGIYLTILGLILTIQAFFNVNFGTVIIKFGAEYRESKNDRSLSSLLKMGYYSAFLSLLLSLVACTLIVFLTRYFFSQNSDQEWNVVVLALTLGLTFVDYISDSFLRLHFLFKLTSTLTIVSSFIDLILNFLVVWFFGNNFTYFLFGIAAAKLTSSAVYNLLAYYYIRKLHVLPVKIPLSEIKSDYKRILHFISSNYGSRLLKNIIEQGDVLVLGMFSTQSEVGIYGVGKRIGYAILSFIDPLIYSIFPQFTQLIAQKKHFELLQLIKQFSLILLIPGLLVLVLAFFTKEFIVTLLYGAAFEASANVFFIILLAAIVAAITFWNITLLVSLNALNFRFKLNVLLLVYSFAAAYWIIPEYGAIGAACILVSIKIIESGFGSFKSISVLKKHIAQ